MGLLSTVRKWLAFDIDDRADTQLIPALDIKGEGLPENPDIQDRPVPVRWKGRITPEVAGRIYEASPCVRASVDMIAGYGCSIPLRMYRKIGDKPERVDTSSWIAKTLEYINPSMSKVEYVYTLLVYLVLYDAFYVGIIPNEGADKQQHPFHLYPMDPQKTKVVPHENGHYYYQYLVAGNMAYLRDDEIITSKGYNPRDNFMGFSKLNAVELPLEQEWALNEYLARFFNDGITLCGVITTDETGNGDETQKIRKQLETNYRGSDKAFKMMVLEKGQKYQDVQSGQYTASYPPINELAVEAIRAALGTPTLMFTGDSRQLESVEEVFWNRTLVPYMDRIDSAHDKYLAKKFTTNGRIAFDYSGVMAIKRQLFSVMRFVVAGVNTGVFSINDAREMLLGMPGWRHDRGEWGDLDNYPDAIVPMVNDVIKLQIAKLQAQAGQQSGGSSGDGDAPESSRGNSATDGSGNSPSMTAADGSTGAANSSIGTSARDQSSDGEAQMMDESGSKSFENWFKDTFPTEEEKLFALFE